jgi:uncharacterized protein involved in exopolysaccharide biosynthesis
MATTTYTTDARRARNRLAALSKHHAPDHPRVAAARADLAAVKLRAEIEAATLRPDQRAELAALLLGGAA